MKPVPEKLAGHCGVCDVRRNHPDVDDHLTARHEHLCGIHHSAGGIHLTGIMGKEELKLINWDVLWLVAGGIAIGLALDKPVWRRRWRTRWITTACRQSLWC
ncbi:putative transporter [Photobacterium aphoticum]|uniref:Putative transporter n=1 Tax=Photobacterium aphoticum TaxID=754436 RepID=A0A090QYQ5_9GAMM|nr:putative transporter [Photobacterium aphoticum]